MEQHTGDFVRLYAANQQALYRYILMLVMDPNDANDILQETAVALFSKHDQYDKNRPFIPWAKRFAYLQVLQFRKKNRSRVVFDSDIMDLVAQHADRLSAMESERGMALKACLERVPARGREVLEYRYGTNMSVEEIGQQVNRSRVAVYRQLSRLRKFLYECVRERLDRGAAV